METIEDILREMRGHPLCWLTPADIPQMSHDNEVLAKYADRIESALHATVRTDNSQTLANALAENERLKAALKPVLECDTDGIVLNFEEDQIVGAHDVAIGALDAVYKAQLTYKGDKVGAKE